MVQVYWKSQRWSVIYDQSCDKYGICDGHDIQYPFKNGDNVFDYGFEKTPRFVAKHFRKLYGKKFQVDPMPKSVPIEIIMK